MSVSVRPWIRLTFLGWLLGIVLVIAIAFITEMAGIRAAQIPVGLGMGLGVGMAQERALRPFLGPLSQGIAAIETLVRHAGQGETECDCLIVPHMEGRSYFQFAHYEQFIALGEEATRRRLPVILEALERAERAPAPPPFEAAPREFDHLLVEN